MAAFVIDSSVAAAWCFPDEGADYTNGILRILSASEAVAPRLWAYEVRNSVLMGLRRKRIAKVEAERFLESIQSLAVRLTDPPSYDVVFQLAESHGLTIYDAAYLDLSMREHLPLATLDTALVRAAGQSGIAIFKP